MPRLFGASDLVVGVGVITNKPMGAARSSVCDHVVINVWFFENYRCAVWGGTPFEMAGLIAEGKGLVTCRVGVGGCLPHSAGDIPALSRERTYTMEEPRTFYNRRRCQLETCHRAPIRCLQLAKNYSLQTQFWCGKKNSDQCLVLPMVMVIYLTAGKLMSAKLRQPEISSVTNTQRDVFLCI